MVAGPTVLRCFIVILRLVKANIVQPENISLWNNLIEHLHSLWIFVTGGDILLNKRAYQEFVFYHLYDNIYANWTYMMITFIFIFYIF